MTEHAGGYSEIRRRVERAAPQKLSRPFDEAYGLALKDLEYSQSEIVRAQENFAFGKHVADGFFTLLRARQITVEEISRLERRVAKNCSPAQKKILRGVVQDLARLIEQTATKNSSEAVAEAKTFLRKRFGLGGNEEGVYVTITSLGAVKVRIYKKETWRKLVRRLGADEETAPLVGGFVLPIPRYVSKESALEHLKNEGRFVFINGKYESVDQPQVEDHEMSHWLRNQVFVNHERPVYRNPEANSFFLDVKNELVAYATGESLQPSLSRLVGRDETGQQAFNRFVESLRIRRENVYILTDLKEANLLSKNCPELPLGNSLSLKLEEHRQLTGRGRVEIAKERQRICHEAYVRSKEDASKAGSELIMCLREIARLDVQRTRSFDLIFPAMIGAQSFKELAYFLSTIDRRDAAYDAAQEFGDVAPENIDLCRADEVVTGVVKWRIPVQHLDILIAKLRERLQIMKKESVLFSAQSQTVDLKILEGLLDFYDRG